MPTILALDEGTTGTTALVIGPDGAVLGRGYREIPQHFPAPGHVEHDPEILFHATVAAARASRAGSAGASAAKSGLVEATGRRGPARRRSPCWG